ncbi:CSC1-like protein [Chlorella vulgaris]
MATDGKSLAITTGIYSIIAIVVFILFSKWRTARLTKKFFSPKLFVKDPGSARPPNVKSRFGAWVPQVLYMSEADLIRCGGVDAAMYIKILRMGFEIFCVVAFFTLVIILPINLTGGEVDKLMATPAGLETNPLYKYLVPAAAPAPEASSDSSEENKITTLPDIYNSTVGDAPPGMMWWNYNNNINPDAYQTPEEVLGPAFATYGWMWLQSYQEIKYKFSSLDKTTIANVTAGSARLWAHAVVTYVVSFFIYYWLWKYNKEGLRLRIFYLINQPAGAESHTVLCQDVPGVPYGTIPQRADGTLLKLIPKSIKEKAYQQTAMLARKGTGTFTHGVGKVGHAVEGHAKELGGADDIESANAAAAEALSGGGKMHIDPSSGRWEMRDAWVDAVQGIQGHEGSVHGMVEEEFRKVYHDDLAAVHMVHDTSKLDPLVAEYAKVRLAATDLVDNYISLKRRGKELKPKKVTVIGATMGAWGREKYGMKPTKVDAFEFYRDRLTELRRGILEEQGKAQAPHSVFPAAFVTFRRRTSQVVAARTLMSEDLSAWRCQAAPRAEEIVWHSLGFRIWERSARSLAMYAAYIAMAAFFMIPVAAVQGLLSLNSFAGFLNSIPILGALLTGMLPGLALKIFLALVPMIITAMNRFAGMISESQIDLGLVSRYFYFQVITLFLGSFIAGTFANQMKQFIADPGSIITIFGTSAPQTAIFFMTYLLLEALLTTSLTLMRVVPLIIFWERLWSNQLMAYGTVVPNDTIAFLLGLTFCTICPIIAPVACAYFMFNYLVWKYQQVYVYTPTYQSGGLVWIRVFDQCMLGLIMFHLMMTAILGVKKSIGAPILCFLLLAFDFVFWVAVHSRFWRPQECLSLISAADMDAQDRGSQGDSFALAKGVDAQMRDRYLSPSFKFDDEEHEQAMTEVQRMAAVLAGGEDEKLFAAPQPTEESEAPHSSEGDVESGSGGHTSASGPDAVAVPRSDAPPPPLGAARPEVVTVVPTSETAAGAGAAAHASDGQPSSQPSAYTTAQEEVPTEGWQAPPQQGPPRCAMAAPEYRPQTVHGIDTFCLAPARPYALAPAFSSDPLTEADLERLQQDCAGMGYSPRLERPVTAAAAIKKYNYLRWDLKSKYLKIAATPPGDPARAGANQAMLRWAEARLAWEASYAEWQQQEAQRFVAEHQAWAPGAYLPGPYPHYCLPWGGWLPDWMPEEGRDNEFLSRNQKEELMACYLRAGVKASVHSVHFPALEGCEGCLDEPLTYGQARLAWRRLRNVTAKHWGAVRKLCDAPRRPSPLLNAWAKLRAERTAAGLEPSRGEAEEEDKVGAEEEEEEDEDEGPQLGEEKANEGNGKGTVEVEAAVQAALQVATANHQAALEAAARDAEAAQQAALDAAARDAEAAQQAALDAAARDAEAAQQAAVRAALEVAARDAEAAQQAALDAAARDAEAAQQAALDAAACDAEAAQQAALEAAARDAEAEKQAAVRAALEVATRDAEAAQQAALEAAARDAEAAQQAAVRAALEVAARDAEAAQQAALEAAARDAEAAQQAAVQAALEKAEHARQAQIQEKVEEAGPPAVPLSGPYLLGLPQPVSFSPWRRSHSIACACVAALLLATK